MARVFRNANGAAAHMPGVGPLLDKAAEEILGRARANAASHVRSGQYQASLGISRGKLDRYVYSDDPQAIPIEFGHVTKSGRYVPGQHILIDALHGGG